MQHDDRWQDWVGREAVADDTVTPVPVAALAATLDAGPVDSSPGAPLPPLWHWLYFLPLHPRSALAEDGHAQRGQFLPPVPLPRRMWAGGEFEFHRPLRIGERIVRRSRIERVESKRGRSGTLVFVGVRHDIHVADAKEAALRERHDIVYREAARSDAPEPPPRPAPVDALWEEAWTPDDVLLFRYSALTFNPHRIHYDRRYVTEVEGYPGLVVHGPLIATLLMELLRKHLPRADVARFGFRALRPLFDTHRFHVCGTPDAQGGTVALWARDDSGALAMEASATLR